MNILPQYQSTPSMSSVSDELESRASYQRAPLLAQPNPQHRVTRHSFCAQDARVKSSKEEMVLTNALLTDSLLVSMLRSSMIKSDTIVRLDLSSNRIRDTGANAIARLLIKSNCLRHINLQRNFIRNVDAFAVAIEINTSLQTLSLGSNRIHNVGRLARALTVNTTLEVLDLHENRFQDTTPLGEALPFMKLKHLDLSESAHSTQPGFLAPLAKGIMENTTLCSLSLVRVQEGQESTIQEGSKAFQYLHDITYCLGDLHRKSLELMDNNRASERVKLALWPFLLRRISGAATYDKNNNRNAIYFFLQRNKDSMLYLHR